MRASIVVLAGGLALGVAAVAAFMAPARSLAAADPAAAGQEVDGTEMSGPFIADRDVMMILDRASPDGDCRRSGHLVFGCLIQARATADAHEAPIGALANPFNLGVATTIRDTILADLTGFRASGQIKPTEQLWPAFLTNPGSRIELVGVVNRIDRQFIEDPVPGAEGRERCGEISVVYRFSYALDFGGGRSVFSRLPVTMNVVFPAVPRSWPADSANCAEVALRWQREMERPASRTSEQVAADLTDPDDGIVAMLDGRDIDRIELNMQAYRVPASADETDLGSTAEYVIRVFRWHPDRRRYVISYLTNQIDRARILGNARGDDNSCDPGASRPIPRSEFLAYLSQPAVLSDIDTGTLNIPQRFLACRATSVSPGGAYRSGNSQYWNATSAAEQIVTNDQIRDVMRRAEGPLRQFSFMRSPEDFRLRLSELSCTGCHQARGIAGFHFPGADRPNTPVSNAVFLPGSPHFYGDQSRRAVILRRLANGERLSRYDLASSYSSRPLNRFRPELAHTELLGGWGGACLLPAAIGGSRREWTCRPNLQCVALFESANAPGMGTCVPTGRPQIGDAMQSGRISSKRFGFDTYLRTSPALPMSVADWTRPQNRDTRDTRIPESAFPSDPPPGNGYYAAHQEFYRGSKPTGTEPPAVQNQIRRDSLTGGFPSGMLRFSECLGLPDEATCGLTASSGFNDCIAQVAKGPTTLADCFAQRTSYAGMRACTSTSPCRDDYICLRPIGYDLANGHSNFLRRQSQVSYARDDFGQQEPDRAWLGRNGGRGDQRGICIPPYFVFQFRSDGHPRPPS